jgi:hypothetical protein
MARKPYVDLNPQLGRPGIARRFAATEERKPPRPVATPAPEGDTVEARRAAPMTGSRSVGAAPTIGSDLKKVDAHVIQPHEYDEAPELTEAEIKSAVLHEGGVPDDPTFLQDVDKIKKVTADVNAFADKLAADKAARKRAKGHGKVVLPRAPIIKASDLKPPKKAKAKKRGRPATSKKPWLDAGVSRATYFRRQGKSG